MSEEKDRFVGPNGEFQPTHEPPPGKMTIAYLEELMEWTYYHNNITEEERKENILRFLYSEMVIHQSSYLLELQKKK